MCPPEPWRVVARRRRRRLLAGLPGARARPRVLAWSARLAVENVNPPARGKRLRIPLRRVLRGACSEPNPKLSGSPVCQRTAIPAPARASRISVSVRARGSARRIPLRSLEPRPRYPTPIGTLRGKKTRRDNHSHGNTKSPASQGGITATGEQVWPDQAADKHRHSDEHRFGDAPPRLRQGAQRTPAVATGHPQKLSNKPRDRGDRDDVSWSLVRGRDGLCSAEHTRGQDKTGRNRRATNGCVVCLASCPKLILGRAGSTRTRRLSFHSGKLADNLPMRKVTNTSPPGSGGSTKTCARFLDPVL